MGDLKADGRKILKHILEELNVILDIKRSLSTNK